MKTGTYWSISFIVLLIAAALMLLIKFTYLGNLIFFSDPEIVGAESCVQCHEEEVAQWNSSTHHKAELQLHCDTPATVSCEFCHGPASNHLRWARSKDRRKHLPKPSDRMGFTNMNIAALNAEENYLSGPDSRCVSCHSSGRLIAGKSDDSQLLKYFLPEIEHPGFFDIHPKTKDSGEHKIGWIKILKENPSCLQCHNPHSLIRINADNSEIIEPMISADISDSIENILHAGEISVPGMESALLDIAVSTTYPAYLKAQAQTLLGSYTGTERLTAAMENRSDPNPLIRYSAAVSLFDCDPLEAYPILYPLLQDPLLAVRMVSMKALSSLPMEDLRKQHKLDFGKAMDEYVSILSLDSCELQSLVDLGNYMLYHQRNDNAVLIFERAQLLDPGSSDALLGLAAAYDNTNGRDAEKMLQSAIEQQAASAPLYYSYGVWLMEHQRYEEAAELFQKASALAPDIAYYPYLEAYALDAADEELKAAGILEHALQQFPDTPHIIMGLESIYRNIDELDKADSCIAVLHSLKP